MPPVRLTMPPCASIPPVCWDANCYDLDDNAICSGCRPCMFDPHLMFEYCQSKGLDTPVCLDVPICLDTFICLDAHLYEMVIPNKFALPKYLNALYVWVHN